MCCNGLTPLFVLIKAGLLESEVMANAQTEQLYTLGAWPKGYRWLEID